MIAFMRHEDLGLVGEAAERGRMDDPVAIALELFGWRTTSFVSGILVLALGLPLALLCRPTTGRS